MTFVSIKDVEPTSHAELRRIYETSFPVHERRTWMGLMNLLSEPAMHFDVLKKNDKIVGFAIWWQLDKWLYLEHFAILNALRGQGLGKETMKHLIKISKGYLLLETELPNTEDAAKRVAFYERLGFQKIGYPYFQPPYRANEAPFAMQLMSSNSVSEQEIIELINRIRQEVYEKFYDGN